MDDYSHTAFQCKASRHNFCGAQTGNTSGCSQSSLVFCQYHFTKCSTLSENSCHSNNTLSTNPPVHHNHSSIIQTGITGSLATAVQRTHSHNKHITYSTKDTLSHNKHINCNTKDTLSHNKHISCNTKDTLSHNKHINCSTNGTITQQTHQLQYKGHSHTTNTSTAVQRTLSHNKHISCSTKDTLT